MMKIVFVAVACLVCSTTGYSLRTNCNKTITYLNSYMDYEIDLPFPFVSREAWGAQPPKSVTKLNPPVPFVVIHHTYIPAACETSVQCEASMRAMQHVHMDTNGWEDIGYNFAVGGEGSVYEGRSWQAVGAHAVGYNSRSIGIVLIGDFVSQLPVAKQLQAAKDLIAAGVRLGFIRPDYKLIGHRQASATECPGSALYNEITTWDHFTLV